MKDSVLSRWVAVLPLLLIGSIALAAGLLLGHALDKGFAVAVPHVLVVLSWLLMLYALVFLRPVLGISIGWNRVVVSAAAIALGLFIVCFYAAMSASFMFFRELPTRQLIAGYLRDLPALIGALPVAHELLAAGLGAIVIAGLALGLLVAWSLDVGREVIERWTQERAAKFLLRAGAYGGATHLVFSFAVPLGWQLDNHEPLFSSWHNARLSFAQRDPVRSALDVRAAEAYPRLAAARRPNVILVYVDALRADVTQPYGSERQNMPFVSSMVAAGELKQVDMVLAACPATICGLGAILQSRPTWLQGPDNFSLPKALALQGYRNAYVLASNHQDFLNLKDYYQPIDFFVDGKELSPAKHGDDYLVLEGLERLGRWDGRPTFLMVGIISPHLSGIRDVANRKYLPDRATLRSDGQESIKGAFRNNYDNGVLQADDVLRKLWAALDKNGYLSDAIVVITSDHGESLGERGLFGHYRSLFNTELRIPLWIRDVQAPAAPVRFARQIDIAPTIIASLGLPVPATWHGRSIYELPPVAWSEHYVRDVGNQIAVVRHDGDSTLKYLVDRSNRAEKVFDLRKDPGETSDVISSVPAELLDQLRSRAEASFLGQ